MTPESDLGSRPGAEVEAKPLCVSCMRPNEPAAHFCAQCGAPMTAYASTGPFESLFAEGHVYRQAAKRPRSLMVVLGVWLIFGMRALAGLVMVLGGRDMGIGAMAFGAFMLTISVLLIWKCTRNYLSRHKTDGQHAS